MQLGSPFYIIGQGLAGTFISFQLNQRGIEHQVISTPELSKSSEIAAGLINPIVLKRLKWVSGAELFWPALLPFYRQLEELLEGSYLISSNLIHLFKQPGTVNQWLEKSSLPHFENHLGPTGTELPDGVISENYGWGQLKNIYWVQTAALLLAYREYLVKRDQYLESAVPNNPKAFRNFLKERKLSPNQVIVCTGHLTKALTQEKATIFTPTKGEVLVVRAPDLPQENIWHSKVFALPLGNALFKVGATYAHQNLNDKPTSEGLAELIAGFKAIYTGSFDIVSHEAGVRPNVKDRKPLLGKIPNGPYIFNGFGSRGTLLGPYLSGIMANHLLTSDDIPPQWDINRFI